MTGVSKRRDDAGFTLVEVLLATGLFAFVAFAGFEVLRATGASLTMLSQRQAAAAQLALAVAELRSDALSSAAVWRPPSVCGDALSFMKREAGTATSFLIYVARSTTNAGVVKTSLYRGASAMGPLNPCDRTLAVDPIVDTIASFQVLRLSAAQLAAHSDPVSGTIDGGIFDGAGIASIAIDAHAKDYDGSTILGGNDVTEVTIDADPVQTTLDLVAGNRPSGFTNVLAYTCGDRCKSTTVFPETRGAAYTACAVSYDLPDTPTFYAPAAGQPVYVPAGNGRLKPVIRAYNVNVGYVFTFTGAGGASAREELYVNSPSWSLPGMQDTPAVGPDGLATADYTSNSVRAAGPSRIFSDLNGAGVLATQIARCNGMNAERNDFRN